MFVLDQIVRYSWFYNINRSYRVKDFGRRPFFENKSLNTSSQCTASMLYFTGEFNIFQFSAGHWLVNKSVFHFNFPACRKSICLPYSRWDKHVNEKINKSQQGDSSLSSKRLMSSIKLKKKKKMNTNLRQVIWDNHKVPLRGQFKQ